ncbi:MAG: tetratricopeptide repeat protein, partial [Acidobacteriota bacterium]
MLYWNMPLAVLLFTLPTVFLPAPALQQRDANELYLAGVEHYNRGELEEAIRLLQRAAALQPNVPDYRFSLGLAYLKAGRARRAARELEAVRGMIGVRRATRLKEPEVLVPMATAYMKLGNLATARDRLELALQRDPAFAEAYYALGLLDQKEDREEDAVAQFQAAVEAEPDHPGANLALAQWLRGQGRLEEARERLQHASRGAP